MWFENDGNEIFTQHDVSIVLFEGTNFGAQAVAVGDVNNDGFLDIVTSMQSSKRIVWYENDGNQNFWNHVHFVNQDSFVPGLMDVAGAKVQLSRRSPSTQSLTSMAI